MAPSLITWAGLGDGSANAKLGPRPQIGLGPIDKGKGSARQGLYTWTKPHTNHLEQSETTVPTTTRETELPKYGEPRQSTC